MQHFNSGRDYEHSLAMQKLLKNEIGSIDVFLLLFSGAATRDQFYRFLLKFVV
jgi:hypothetical protein